MRAPRRGLRAFRGLSEEPELCHTQSVVALAQGVPDWVTATEQISRERVGSCWYEMCLSTRMRSLCCAAAVFAFALGCGSQEGGSTLGGGGSETGPTGTGGATGGSGVGGSGGAPESTGTGAGTACPPLEFFHTSAQLIAENGEVEDNIDLTGITGVVAEPSSACGEAESLVVVDTGGKTWTVCAETGGYPLPVSVGQSISFDIEGVSNSDPGEFYTRLAIYDASGARLFFAESFAADGGPGFVIEEGPYICGGEDAPKCIFSRRSAIFSVGEESIQLEALEIGVVGGLEFHVGADAHYGDGGACDSNTGWVPNYFVVNAPVAQP